MQSYLEITVPERELFNEKTGTFYTVKSQTLRLQHSLISLSKWESKWKISFLSTPNKTMEQTLDYVRAMTITRDVDPTVYSALTPELLDKISDYINDPMTATKINDQGKSPMSRKVFTSEVIYYWMIALNIPKDFEQWHLNRLLTLISVCNLENAPKKKLSPMEAQRKAMEMNAFNRKKYNSRG